MSTVTVLLGTTNASKITRFRDLLDGNDLTFLTLNDRQIREEPPETGATPEENAILKAAFYLTDTPSPKRQPGWPLNSISLNRHTLTYFSEAGNNKYDAPTESVLLGDYRKRLVAFLVEALGL